MQMNFIFGFANAYSGLQREMRWLSGTFVVYQTLNLEVQGSIPTGGTMCP